MSHLIASGKRLLASIARRAMLERGLVPDFPPEARSQTAAVTRGSAAPEPGLRDLRHLLWASIEARGFPALRRVLRSPERWERIVALAAGLGERLPPEPDAPALEGFLARRRSVDPERFPDLSLSVVKLLGSGEYVLELPGQAADGHFGLAVRDYTHSTAPNRRFPDLITQRLVKAALAGAPPPYANEELEALAHCTEQEDNAAKVERQVRKSAAALLLAARIGERFDAIVTGASPKGTWVRISRPAVEGRVVRGFERMDVGDRVRVELVRTDVERGFIDFERSEEAS
jgi:plasmid stabilization system protein ParE